MKALNKVIVTYWIKGFYIAISMKVNKEYKSADNNALPLGFA